MSEQVGEIYYDVDANTGNLINSQKDVDRTLNRMGSSFQRFDGKVKSSSKAVNRGIAGMGRSFGQVGIQIQQLVGQVQGGTSALVALGQQGADIGIVMGAPLLGAIIGIGSAIGTALLPQLFKSKKATEELAKAMEALDKTAKRSSDGVVSFTERVRELAKISKTAAIAELQAAIVRTEDVAKSAAKGVSEAFNEELKKVGDVPLDAFGSLSNIGTLQDLGKQFGVVGENAADTREKTFALGKEIATLISRLNKTPSPENFNALQNRLNELIVSSPKVSDDMKKLNSNLVELFSQAKSASEIQKELNKQLKEFSKESTNAGEKINASLQKSTELSKAFRDQLAIAQTKFNQGELAAQKMAARIELGLNAAQKLPPELEQTIEKLFNINKELEKQGKEGPFTKVKKALEGQLAQLKLTEAEWIEYNAIRQAGADATPEQIAKIKSLTAAINEQKTAIEIAKLEKKQEAKLESEIAKQQEERRKKAEEQQKKDLESLKTLGVSPEVQIRQQTIEQLKELDRLYREGDLQSLQDYENRKAEIQKQGAERLSQLNQEVSLIDWESFSNRAAGALTTVIGGAQSGEDAIKGLAQSITLEAIGALIKLTAKSIAAKAAETAAGVSQAATLAAAYAPAASAASIATGGGAAISGATALASVIPGMLAAFSVGGGRLYGGGVSPGKLYPVTENGKPELLTQGNKQYLLPGSRGNVTSNKGMGMSQPVINVNISNSAPGAFAEVTGSREHGGSIDLDIVVRAVANDVNEGGSVYQAIQRRTKAGGRTG